jgi:N-methylhydantoinase A/oxoprolinase/acetone carboxylase beta subunit
VEDLSLIAAGEIVDVVHGATVATNALLKHKGDGTETTFLSKRRRIPPAA